MNKFTHEQERQTKKVAHMHPSFIHIKKAEIKRIFPHPQVSVKQSGVYPVLCSPCAPPGVSCTAVSVLMLNTHIKYSTNYSATSPAKVRSRSRSRSAWEAERSRTNTAPRAKERRNGCQVPRGAQPLPAAALVFP